MKKILINDVLDYLGCPPGKPSLQYLNRLIYNYIRKVPWESVSRIIKRQATLRSEDCPRLPEEFWRDALQFGFGGTCFESSLAFYRLLTALGFEGYLTVNDMGENHACHAAIVLLIKGDKYLVDITIPLHVAIRINPSRSTTRRHTAFHDYTIRPLSKIKYEVVRSHHPNRNAFTLIDIPVSPKDYQTTLEKDYTEAGFFLKSVVMVKIVGSKVWRFFSDHKPYKLVSFNRSGKSETLLQPETMSRQLAELFQMPEDKIYAALALINCPQPVD